MENSMFTEFEETMRLLKNGDKKAAMIILERKSSGENKHAIVGNPENAIVLLEWGIHMYADGLGCSFSDVINMINDVHKNTSHYMKNVHKGEL